MPPKSRSAKSKATKEAEPVVSQMRTRRMKNDTTEEENVTIKSKTNTKQQSKEDKLPVKNTRASRNKSNVESETVETAKTVKRAGSPTKASFNKEQVAVTSDPEDDKQLTSQRRGRKKKADTDTTAVQSSKSSKNKVVSETVETKSKGKKSSSHEQNEATSEPENRTLRNRTRTSSKDEKVEKAPPVKATRARRGKLTTESDEQPGAADGKIEEKESDNPPVKKTQIRRKAQAKKKGPPQEHPVEKKEESKPTRSKRTKTPTAAVTTEKTIPPTRSLRASRQRTTSTEEESSLETKTSRQPVKATVRRAAKRGRAEFEDSEAEESRPTRRKTSTTTATATAHKQARKSTKSEVTESKLRATRTSQRQTRSQKDVEKDDQSQPFLELKRLTTVPEESETTEEGKEVKSRKIEKIEDETDTHKEIPPVIVDVMESIKEKIESSFKAELSEHEPEEEEEEEEREEEEEEDEREEEEEEEEEEREEEEEEEEEEEVVVVEEEEERDNEIKQDEDNGTSEISMDVNVDINSERGTIGDNAKLDEEDDEKSNEQNLEEEEIDVEKTIGFQEKSINDTHDITVTDETFESDQKDVNITKDSLNITVENTMTVFAASERPTTPVKRKSEDIEENGDKLISDKQLKKTRIKLLEPPLLPDVGGRLMTFGEDISGELGQKVNGIIKRSPVPVEGIKGPIVYHATGGLHNVCINSEGHVYTFGCNDAGALGRITTSNDEGLSNETEPAKVPLPSKIVKVTAGDSHSAALTSFGSVFYWGNFKDSNGFIGLTPESTKHEFQPIAIDIQNVNFVDIASGADHLLLLSENGDVYSLGVGEQGQLGRLPVEEVKFTKNRQKVFLKPHLVKFPEENVVCDRVWAGHFSSFARTTDGTIYGWGLNNYSQLGFKFAKGQGDKFSPYPVLIPGLSDLGSTVEEICVGQHHSLALDSRKRVYSFGRFEYGRLGHGKTKCDEDKPRLIESLKGEFIINIATGTVSSFAVSEKGHLYSWGMEAAQLGVSGGDLFEPTPVTSSILEKSKVLRVAAGSQHTAIIVKLYSL